MLGFRMFVRRRRKHGLTWELEMMAFGSETKGCTGWMELCCFKVISPALRRGILDMSNLQEPDQPRRKTESLDWTVRATKGQLEINIDPALRILITCH